MTEKTKAAMEKLSRDEELTSLFAWFYSIHQCNFSEALRYFEMVRPDYQNHVRIEERPLGFDVISVKEEAERV